MCQRCTRRDPIVLVTEPSPNWGESSWYPNWGAWGETTHSCFRRRLGFGIDLVSYILSFDFMVRISYMLLPCSLICLFISWHSHLYLSLVLQTLMEETACGWNWYILMSPLFLSHFYLDLGFQWESSHLKHLSNSFIAFLDVS